MPNELPEPALAGNPLAAVNTQCPVLPDRDKQIFCEKTLRERTMRSALSIGVVLSMLFSAAAAHAAEPCGVSALTKALASADESARLEAIDRLVLMGSEAASAVPSLADLLKDKSAAVRAHAAEALGSIGAPAKPAVPALASLITDADEGVRREAVEAIGNIRPGPEVMVPLLAKVLEGSDEAVVLRALNALAEMGEKVVPFLVKALKNEKTAYWACLVVSEIGPDAKAAVTGLTELARSGQPDVQREAIIALAEIGAASAPAVPTLAKALDDKVVGIAATYALGRIGRIPDEVETKIEKNAKSSDAILSTVSMWALARLHPDNKALLRRAVELLAEGLKSQNARHRAAAARALIDLDPDPEISRPIIKKAMDGAEPEVLKTMMDAMAGLGEKVLPRLIEGLKIEEVRARAAAIIARIGPKAKAAVPALIDALGDENPETRNEVLFALAAIGQDAKACVPVVIKSLADPDMNVRYAACYTLAQIGPAAMAAKPALRKNLGCPDQFLSVASAAALAGIHPQCAETAAKSVPVLAKALGAADAMIRLNAAESLQCLGPLAKEAVPALKKALEDNDAKVRDAAATALQAIDR